jgi:hypothetical protein
MGKGDKSRKMRQKASQTRKKARVTRQIEASVKGKKRR